MNNDVPSSPSSTRIRDPSPSPLGVDADDADAQDDESQARSHQPNGRRRKRKSRSKKQHLGLTQKLAFVTHLLKTLDMMVFAQLSSLYYMECSILRFGIRAFSQYMYLAPKGESFPIHMPTSRLHVLLVLIPNLICMFLHVFASLPEGSESHRGYQHGGLIIDLIGQKPPTSRLYYLLADFGILIVQCLMLTVHNDRERLRVTLKTFRPLRPEVAQVMNAAPSAEDLDAEERGVLRDAPTVVVDETVDIEMQQLGRPEATEGERNDRSGESESQLQDSPGDWVSRNYLSDVMNSGNAIIGEYHVVHTIQTATMDLERTTATSLQTISYGATMAALRARPRGIVQARA